MGAESWSIPISPFSPTSPHFAQIVMPHPGVGPTEALSPAAVDFVSPLPVGSKDIDRLSNSLKPQAATIYYCSTYVFLNL